MTIRIYSLYNDVSDNTIFQKYEAEGFALVAIVPVSGGPHSGGTVKTFWTNTPSHPIDVAGSANALREITS